MDVATEFCLTLTSSPCDCRHVVADCRRTFIAKVSRLQNDFKHLQGIVGGNFRFGG